MQEVELKFLAVDHNKLRQKLQQLQAKQVHEMRLMRRLVFNWPQHKEDSFVRVRDEGDKVTLTYKKLQGSQEVEKLETTVGDYETAVAILQKMGAFVKSRQESKREVWQLDEATIMFDEWPWLKPFIEIKAKNKETANEVAAKLGFQPKEAVQGTVNEAFKGEYAIPDGVHICDEANIAFDLPKPGWLSKL